MSVRLELRAESWRGYEPDNACLLGSILVGCLIRILGLVWGGVAWQSKGALCALALGCGFLMERVNRIRRKEDDVPVMDALRIALAMAFCAMLGGILGNLALLLRGVDLWAVVGRMVTEFALLILLPACAVWTGANVYPALKFLRKRRARSAYSYRRPLRKATVEFRLGLWDDVLRFRGQDGVILSRAPRGEVLAALDTLMQTLEKAAPWHRWLGEAYRSGEYLRSTLGKPADNVPLSLEELQHIDNWFGGDMDDDPLARFGDLARFEIEPSSDLTVWLRETFGDGQLSLQQILWPGACSGCRKDESQVRMAPHRTFDVPLCLACLRARDPAEKQRVPDSESPLWHDQLTVALGASSEDAGEPIPSSSSLWLTPELGRATAEQLGLQFFHVGKELSSGLAIFGQTSPAVDLEIFVESVNLNITAHHGFWSSSIRKRRELLADPGIRQAFAAISPMALKAATGDFGDRIWEKGGQLVCTDDILFLSVGYLEFLPDLTASALGSFLARLAEFAARDTLPLERACEICGSPGVELVFVGLVNGRVARKCQGCRHIRKSLFHVPPVDPGTVDRLKQQLTLQPDSIAARYGLMYVCNSLEQWEEALRWCQEILAREPKHPEARRALPRIEKSLRRAGIQPLPPAAGWLDE